MLEKKHRNIIIIAFVIGLVFLLLTLHASYNAFFDEEKDTLGAWPVIAAFISILAFSYLFRIAHKLSDFKGFSSYVNEQIANGRAEILAELRSEEEKKKSANDTVDDSAEKAKAIVPAGNYKNIDSFGKKLLTGMANELNVVQAVFYTVAKGGKKFDFSAGYALPSESTPIAFDLGENLNGEAAKSQTVTFIDDIPADYFTVESGLGNGKAGQLCLLPIVADGKTIALIELASFAEFTEKRKKIIEQASKLIATKLQQLVKA